jgi:Protein of unknown function (DUF664)
VSGIDLGGQLGEREMLTGFLDWYRAVVERKLEGLPLADATRELTASGLSALGVLKHLGWVECRWFREAFAGEDVDSHRVGDRGDNSHEFLIEPTDTVESVLDSYRAQVARCRTIVAEASSLDTLSRRQHDILGAVSLRWILVHQIEETSRHAGHLDLMREELDGQTGD